MNKANSFKNAEKLDLKYYKYTLRAILIISIIFLCGDIFGGQDSAYLKKYFENAIFLYESSKYKEAILLFEKIIETENAEGEFYFTPFAEIYIDKSRNKDITLMPQNKKQVKIRSKSVSKKSDREYLGIKDSKENAANSYDNMIDYYANKQKIAPLAARPENIKGNDMEMEPKKEKAVAISANEILQELLAEPKNGKQIATSADKIRQDLLADKIRQDLLNEKLEEDLGNLDQDTLKSFDDERFSDYDASVNLDR